MKVWPFWSMLIRRSLIGVFAAQDEPKPRRRVAIRIRSPLTEEYRKSEDRGPRTEDTFRGTFLRKAQIGPNPRSESSGRSGPSLDTLELFAMLINYSFNIAITQCVII